MTSYLSAEIQSNALMRASAINILEACNYYSPPINVYQLIIDEDVSVDFWKFHKIEGLYIKNIAGSNIAINTYHPVTKKRFTAAHELKHHLHDIPENGPPLLPCLPDVKRQIEIRANSFATELLVPYDMLQNVIEELGEELTTITSLARVFCVSYEMMVYRLNSLRYISDKKKRKYLTKSYRAIDNIETETTKEIKEISQIKTPSILEVFGVVDTNLVCKTCKAVVHDSTWNVCSQCCSDL